MLRDGELPAFRVESRSAVVTNVDEWSERFFASPPSLRRAGFVRGLREKLDGTTRGVVGYSFVAEFRTPTRARDEVANELASPHAPGSYAAFPVAGIPGAHGFTLTGAGLYNVMFSDGRYQYGRGAIGGSSAARAQVIAAAQALYRRLHGH